MEIRKKINSFHKTRSKLDLFLIKAGVLVIIYYGLRIILKFTPLLRPVFLFSRNTLTQIILKISYFSLNTLGYDVNIYKRIIWIEGSQGVRVINACLAWSVMALFIGFIIIYPGQQKKRLWFMPMGIIAITFTNILRITAMVLVSYYNYKLLDFYHKYVFNIILYIVIFTLWIFWVKKYGDK